MKNRLLILGILSILFIAPGVLAYFYAQHPAWFHGKSTNQGLWMQEGLNISVLMPNTSRQWRIVAFAPQGCDDKCVLKVEDLARIRLALGRRLYAVAIWLVTEESSLSKAIESRLKAEDIVIVNLPKDHALRATLPASWHVYLANPAGELMLSYGAAFKPQALFHDLSHLLKAGE